MHNGFDAGGFDEVDQARGQWLPPLLPMSFGYGVARTARVGNEEDIYSCADNGHRIYNETAESNFAEFAQGFRCLIQIPHGVLGAA